MNRFVVLIIVVLFGLASMSGPSMAAGIGSGAFWTIDNQELCLEPASLVEKAPTFKPCSKKINGYAVSCQNMASILPLLAETIFDQRSAIYAKRDRVVAPFPELTGASDRLASAEDYGTSSRPNFLILLS